MDQLHQFHKIFQGLPVISFTIVLGLIVLALGRKLFWLFIGAVGFITGLYIAKHSFYGEPSWVMLLIGLVVGIAGALLAIYLQRIAIRFRRRSMRGSLASPSRTRGRWRRHRSPLCAGR